MFTRQRGGKRADVSSPAAPQHQPALDGVRAVALGAVLVVHGMPSWLPGGFLGVDLFFVLSGLLITTLLLREAERQRVALGAFWLRRARRLLPALVLVVAFVVLAGPRLLPEQDPAPVRGDAAAALSYWANWRMVYRGGDYFTQTAAASPLQHTWSLAIEEQFYLVWPVLLLLALRLRRPRTAIVAGSLAGAAASAVAAWLCYDPRHAERAYFGTDSRAGALLVGCALSAGLPVLARYPRTRRVAALAGAAALAVAWRFADGGASWLYRGGLAGLAVAAAAVLAELAAAPSSGAARLLSVRPLVWLGRISYGGYLWHWPLFAVLDADRTGLTGPGLFAVRAGVTVAAAAVSFVAVEQPIRRAATGRWPRARLVPLAATAAAFLATVLMMVGPVASPPGAVAAAPPPATTAAPPAAPEATESEAAEPAAAATPPVARPGRRPGGARVTVIGDSVSWTLGAYWPGDPRFTLSNQGVQGCGIALLPEIRIAGAPQTNYPYCVHWPDRWAASVAADDPDVVVILLDRWELTDRRLGGRWAHVGEADYDAYLAGQLGTAIRVAAARGARVALLTAPYTRRQERPDGGLWPEDQPGRVDAWNRLLRTVAAGHPARPVVLDLNRVVCPEGAFAWRVGGVRVRSDGLHLTPEGVRRVVAPWLAPELARLATA